MGENLDRHFKSQGLDNGEAITLSENSWYIEIVCFGTKLRAIWGMYTSDSSPDQLTSSQILAEYDNSLYLDVYIYSKFNLSFLLRGSIGSPSSRMLRTMQWLLQRAYLQKDLQAGRGYKAAWSAHCGQNYGLKLGILVRSGLKWWRYVLLDKCWR